MSRVNDPFDPAHMTIEERLEELADLLARGLLRMHRGDAIHADAAAVKESLESIPVGLDEGAQKRLHGPRS